MSNSSRKGSAAEPAPSAPFEPDRLYRNTDPALDQIASKSTRDRWRRQGVGPPFRRLGPGRGSPIAYLGAELNAWIVELAASSTAEADALPSAKRWATRRQGVATRLALTVEEGESDG